MLCREVPTNHANSTHYTCSGCDALYVFAEDSLNIE